MDDRRMLYDYARGVQQAANPAPGVGYPGEHVIRPLQRVVGWLDRNLGQQRSAADAVRSLEAAKPSLQAGLTDAEQATVDEVIEAFGYMADDPAKDRPMTAAELRGHVQTLSRGAAARNDQETQHLLERIEGSMDTPKASLDSPFADLSGGPGLDAAERLWDQRWTLEQGLDPAQVDKFRGLVTSVTAAPRHPAWARGQGDWIGAHQTMRPDVGQTSRPPVDRFLQQGGRGGRPDVADGHGTPTQIDAHAARPAHLAGNHPATGTPRREW